MKIFTLYLSGIPVEQRMLYGNDSAPTPDGWMDTTATPDIKVVPPVPAQVTRFQALAALSNAGLLANAQAAVNASPDPLTTLAWNNAQTFERASPTIASLAGSLGLTSTQIDDLFIAAAKIVA